MELSAHNIVSRVPGSGESIIVNLLSGNADLLPTQRGEQILRGDRLSDDELIGKGYVVDPAEERKRETAAYLDFIDDRDSSEIQLFFVPWYACNFACEYCYQSRYENPNNALTRETIERFFTFVNTRFNGRKKYVTLFGGEPFLSGQEHEETIAYFLAAAANASIDVAVVTNGYSIRRYMPHLSGARIREIQVTLDGTRSVHDARRPLAGGSGTFDQIVAGIDALVDKGIPVNLRVVLDRENIDDLPALARFVIDKRWPERGRFKTQIGRNYELHTQGAYECGRTGTRLFDRLTMYEALLALADRDPEVRDVFTPQFSVMKHLFQNGKLPAPLFDSCPACKTEWAFDYTGSIYPCTATVGKTNERLGSFSPDVSIDETRVAVWEERDVLAIPRCRTCPSRLACGGGCGAVAKNRTGSVLSEDCRPIEGLIGLGARYYFRSEIEDDERNDLSTTRSEQAGKEPS